MTAFEDGIRNTLAMGVPMSQAMNAAYETLLSRAPE